MSITGRTRSSTAASPPTMTVSVPFSAPTHAAAHRRVEKVDAVRRERVGDRARGRGIARRAVDERRAPFSPGEQAVGAVEERVDVGATSRKQVMTTSASRTASAGVVRVTRAGRRARTLRRARRCDSRR